MLPRGFFLRVIEDLSLRGSVAACGWLLGCGILNRAARAAHSRSARTGLYLGSALFTFFMFWLISLVTLVFERGLSSLSMDNWKTQNKSELHRWGFYLYQLLTLAGSWSLTIVWWKYSPAAPSLPRQPRQRRLPLPTAAVLNDANHTSTVLALAKRRALVACPKVAATSLSAAAQQSDCPVCLMPLTNVAANVRITPCIHHFCSPCFESFVNGCRVLSMLGCPLCRGPLCSGLGGQAPQPRQVAPASLPLSPPLDGGGL